MDDASAGLRARRHTALLLSGALLQWAVLLDFPTASAAGEAPAPPDIHQMLMGKFEAMNGTDHGIFHDDVTSMLESYFPVGQSQAETRRIIAEQKLGALRPYMGVNDAGMGQMFVTQFSLVSRMFEHVYAVLNFDFEKGADGVSRLKQMRAYLRAPNM